MRTTTIEELLEDFEFLDSWEDRYRYIIELGDELEDLEDELRVEENRVQGCVSNVWLIASFDASSPPQISFRADSDSQLVRGLVSILIMLCNNQPAPTVLALDVEGFIYSLGTAQPPQSFAQQWPVFDGQTDSSPGCAGNCAGRKLAC